MASLVFGVIGTHLSSVRAHCTHPHTSTPVPYTGRCTSTFVHTHETYLQPHTRKPHALGHITGPGWHRGFPELSPSGSNPTPCSWPDFSELGV